MVCVVAMCVHVCVCVCVFVCHVFVLLVYTIEQQLHHLMCKIIITQQPYGTHCVTN